MLTAAQLEDCNCEQPHLLKQGLHLFTYLQIWLIQSLLALFLSVSIKTEKLAKRTTLLHDKVTINVVV